MRIMANYPSNEERTNYFRLCCAIIEVGSDAMRYTLQARVHPALIKNRIMKCPEHDRRSAGLRPNQWKYINNVVSVRSYKEFDISLSSQILRLLSVQELRDELQAHIQAKDIDTAIQKCPVLTNDPRTKLTPDELNAIKHASTFDTYDECKDKLLWKLYKNLLPNPNPSLVHPTSPWGDSRLPDPSHVTVGDDVERIRLIRNSVYGHISSIEVSNADFKTHWALLEGIMTRADKHIFGKRFKQKLDNIKTTCMDEVSEKRYQDEIKKLSNVEKNVQTKIQNISEDLKNLNSKAKGMDDKVKEIQCDIKEIKDENIRDKQMLIECKAEIENLKVKINISDTLIRGMECRIKQIEEGSNIRDQQMLSECKAEIENVKVKTNISDTLIRGMECRIKQIEEGSNICDKQMLSECKAEIENVKVKTNISDTLIRDMGCRIKQIEGGSKVKINAPPRDPLAEGHQIDQLLHEHPWFHGTMSRLEAEQIILKQGNIGHGVFLVRRSETSKGTHELTINFQGRPKHLVMTIYNDGQCYVQPSVWFRSIFDMLEHFHTYPFPIDSGRNDDLKLTGYVAVRPRTPKGLPRPHNDSNQNLV